MNNETNYNNWPAMVKITTALAHKNLVPNYKVPLYLGYLLLFSGVASFIYVFFNSNFSIQSDGFLNALSLIIVGLANVVTGNSINWIDNNSSWEERFTNKSSALHKFIYLFISLILILSIIVIFKTGGI